MSDPNEEMQYVTRKELREELAPIRSELAPIHREFAAIHAVLKLIVERMATKEDLLRFATKEDLAATEARIRADMAAGEARIRADMATKKELAATEARILEDVARHTHASAEETRAQIRVLDDKYSDVHPRLEKLEAHAPRPKRRTRRRPG